MSLSHVISSYDDYELDKRVVDASHCSFFDGVLSKHVNMNSEFFDKPGFSYFLGVPCETWDVLQYHEAWRKAQHPMNKAAVITAIKHRLGWFQTNGSRDEIIVAKRLLKQLKVSLFVRIASFGYVVLGHTAVVTGNMGDYGSAHVWTTLPSCYNWDWSKPLNYGFEWRWTTVPLKSFHEPAEVEVLS